MGICKKVGSKTIAKAPPLEIEGSICPYLKSPLYNNLNKVPSDKQCGLKMQVYISTFETPSFNRF